MKNILTKIFWTKIFQEVLVRITGDMQHGNQDQDQMKHLERI